MDTMKTILHVDDEPINRELFALNFGFYHKVISAQSGHEALELLIQTPVDVVISDFKMPGMNGVEFCRAAHAHKPDTHYYILTGFDQLYEIDEAISQKIIKKQFPKPMSVPDILKAIS